MKDLDYRGEVLEPEGIRTKGYELRPHPLVHTPCRKSELNPVCSVIAPLERPSRNKG